MKVKLLIVTIAIFWRYPTIKADGNPPPPPPPSFKYTQPTDAWECSMFPVLERANTKIADLFVNKWILHKVTKYPYEQFQNQQQQTGQQQFSQNPSFCTYRGVANNQCNGVRVSYSMIPMISGKCFPDDLTFTAYEDRFIGKMNSEDVQGNKLYMQEILSVVSATHYVLQSAMINLTTTNNMNTGGNVASRVENFIPIQLLIQNHKVAIVKAEAQTFVILRFCSFNQEPVIYILVQEDFYKDPENLKKVDAAIAEYLKLYNISPDTLSIVRYKPTPQPTPPIPIFGAEELTIEARTHCGA
ncbi:hypothetical protein PGB90_006606 [Kerria lacca]